MDSILTVTTASATYDLTTIARVKRELQILDGASDALLIDWVHEESAYFAELCNRVFAIETVSETFTRTAWRDHSAKPLVLARYPVTSVVSVTEDADTALDPSLYQLDADHGLLHRLTAEGGRTRWARNQTIVAYTGGFTLLAGLPRAAEVAVVELVKQRWFAHKRDPQLRVLDITGIVRREWRPQTTTGATPLPQSVQDAIDFFRERPM